MKKTLIISLITAIISVSCCKKNEEKDPKNCNCQLLRETLRQGMLQKSEVLRDEVCIDNSVNVGSFNTGDIETKIYWRCE